MHAPGRCGPRRLTAWGEAVAGGASGGLTRALLSPLDVLKIRLQVHSAAAGGGVLAHGRAILAQDGLRGFWRGSGTGIALWVAYMAVQFPAYSALRGALEGGGGQGAPAPRLLPVALLAGGAAGMVATLATYPLDWARTRLAVAGASGGGAAQGPLRLFAATPLRQWYSGLLPSLYSILPSMALTFYFYEALGRSFERAVPADSPLAPARSLLCGGLSGGLAKLLTYPLDTVKKRMQVAPAQHARGALRALAAIAGGAEGPRGLFKGLAPALAKAVASSALGFACYEGMGALLVLLAPPGLVQAPPLATEVCS